VVRLSRIRNIALLAVALASSGCIPEVLGEERRSSQTAAAPAAQPSPPPVAAQAIPEPPPTRTVGEVLDSGVIITISLASQRMDVFRNGTLWRSSPVSTGRRGKRTPTGVFAILQKKTFHRSNLYSNAPMPYMQRLTWSGIAIHAGHLPGYPASHGCIRVPKAFARELFRVTNPARTAVIVTQEPLRSTDAALALARQSDALVPIAPELLRKERPALAQKADGAAPRPAAARLVAAPQPAPSPAPAPGAPVPAPAGQTIQLAATLSRELATAHWETVSMRRPELKAMQMAIIPAVVKGTRYYRLRASAPAAHAACKTLKRSGIECFPVS
jgi:lipoprotein-anchoring transpeptidase ErfK/SrfK